MTVLAGARGLRVDGAAASDTQRRQDWIDAARGMAIFLVVLGHCLRGLDARGLVPEAVFAAVDTRIYAFHMPVFFALSGLFLAGQIRRTPPRAFLRGRVSRLIWPMVVWTYLFTVFRILSGEGANSLAEPSDLLRLPIPGQDHLWFLWALFLLHLAFLGTRPLIAADGGYPPPVLIALCAGSVLLQVVPIPPELSYWVHDAVRHAPYLLLGIAFGQIYRDGRPPLGARVLAGIVFAGLLALWPVLALDGLDRLAGGLVLTTCFLVLVTGFGPVAPSLWRPLLRLGAASMAIYLTHTLFSAGTRIALLFAGQDGLALHLGFGVLAGLVGPLCLAGLARRTGTTRLLGF